MSDSKTLRDLLAERKKWWDRYTNFQGYLNHETQEFFDIYQNLCSAIYEEEQAKILLQV